MSSAEIMRARYEEMVRAHAADLYRFAYRLTSRADAAQDLVQETCLEAWRSIASQKQPERARGWLFSILRHRWAHQRRDAGRRIRTSDNPGRMAIEPATDAPVLKTLADEETMRDAFAKLDPRFREAFLMVFLQGLTCKQAATELGVPLGTVLSRISRARQELRTTLASQAGPPRGGTIPREESVYAGPRRQGNMR